MRHFPRTIAAFSLLAATCAAVASPPPYYPAPGYPAIGPRVPVPAYRTPQAPAYPQLAYFRPSYQPYPWNYQPRHAQPLVKPAKLSPPSPAAAPPDQEIDSTPAKEARSAVPTQPATTKVAFLERLQPLVERENQRLLDLRHELLAVLDAVEQGRNVSQKQARRLSSLAEKYRVEGDPIGDAEARAELLRKVDQVPISLALAQAANESAWGQSRFAKEGNNLFGIWTYDADNGIVPLNRAPGKKHLVRKFDSIAESVRYYLFTLNSHPAYATLRKIRADMRQRGEPLDGIAMADGLTRYSAKGKEYVRIIQDMIRRFDLATYESPATGEA